MRRLRPIAALALVVHACGGAASPGSTNPPAATSTVTTPSPTIPATEPTTTTLPAPAVPDCAVVWTEDLVHEVAGDDFEFFGANDDASACTYIGDTGGIALAVRASSAEDFAAGRAASSGAGDVEDGDVCDAAYSLDLGATLIMEAYSAISGLTFTVTVSGADPADARAWATDLLAGTC